MFEMPDAREARIQRIPRVYLNIFTSAQGDLHVSGYLLFLRA